MIIAAALAMAFSSHAPWGAPWGPTHTPRDQIMRRHLVVSGWDLRIYHDKFAGAVSCTLNTPTMSFHRDLVIFHLGDGADTANAYFRIDAAPARRAPEAYALLQPRRYFPPPRWV